MYLLGKRYYDADAGVFCQRDAAKDGLSYYAYTSGKVMTAVDPWGKEIRDEYACADAYNKCVKEASADFWAGVFKCLKPAAGLPMMSNKSLAKSLLGQACKISATVIINTIGDTLGAIVVIYCINKEWNGYRVQSSSCACAYDSCMWNAQGKPGKFKPSKACEGTEVVTPYE